MHTCHKLGAASEYKAASFFLKEGYQVYWPAIRQTPHDFVMTMDNKTFQTVQVKTAGWNTSSPPFSYLQCRTRMGNGAPPSSDLFVIVFEDEIWTIPSELIKSSNLSLRSTGPKAGRPWDSFKSAIL